MSPHMPASGGARARLGGGVFGPRRSFLVLVVLLLCTAAPPAARAAGAPGGASVVAQATASSVAVFRTTTSKQPFRTFANPTAYGAPLVFLVRRHTPGWEQVLLPTRPNGTLGWVRARSVALALDPYRLTVSLRAHRIAVWHGGRLVVEEPAVVGRASLPTPTGLYYLAELLKQVDTKGPYGPYAFGLSAYSEALYSFGGGPGQIGLHGTNEPGLLGTSASHGCIRVSNALITRLAGILPLGTPVVISR
jgi:lipoprotein-anchoring transpeptidase ErfK/SrfK